MSFSAMSQSDSIGVDTASSSIPDVLKVYDNTETLSKQSIFSGGLDTGMEIGKFVIDTSNNITNSSPAMERYADRFQGPYARTQLNSPSLVKEKSGDSSKSEERSTFLMDQYFKLINTSMHGQPGSKIESESFYHDFRLPKCYEIPKMRDSNESQQTVSS